MKNGMKQTEIGEIPMEWEVVKLGDIFQRNTRKNAENNQNALTISAQMGLVSQTDYFNKTVASKNLLGYYLLHRGDFAYNKSYSAGYPMGVIKQLDRYDKGVVSTLYICFSRTNKESYSDFYTHYFEAGNFNAQLASIAQEGARAHGLLNVGVKDFFNLLVAKPSLSEQRKIAEILSTLDEKMAIIDEQLAQTQELKKGLMQRLLTKGIGHTQFKDSPLGEIPASWEVASFRDYTKVNQGLQIAIADRHKEYSEGCLPYITIQFLNEKRKEGNIFFVKSPANSVICHEDEILMTRTGNTGIVITGVHGVFHNNFFKVGFNKIQFDRLFLFYYLNSSFIQALIKLYAGSTTIPDLNHGDFYKIPLLKPDIEEQRQIAEIFTTMDDKIGVLQDKKAQYHTLKKGLMQQLLTGQRRVRVAEQVPALV